MLLDLIFKCPLDLTLLFFGTGAFVRMTRRIYRSAGPSSKWLKNKKGGQERKWVTDRDRLEILHMLNFPLYT